MIQVYCHTSLDLCGEDWPMGLPAVPCVGHEIQSRTKHGDFQLCLQVVAVRWVNCGQGYAVARLELHMTEFQKRLPGKREGAADGSIIAFYEWYAPLVGRTVSSFI